MAKTHTPYFALSAKGTIGNSLTTQKRGKETLVRAKPTPSNPRSLAQMYQRWLYEDYVELWHTLSAAAKLTWEANARPYHMTGFAYFMKDRLITLPDIVGYWKLDPPTSPTAFDSGRQGNHASMLGATQVPGIVAGQLLFDGLDDIGTVAYDDSLSLSTTISIECFVTPFAGMGNFKRITHKDLCYSLSRITADVFALYLRIDGAYRYSATIPFFPGISMHLAFTYSSATRQILSYLNGDLVGTVTLVGLATYLINQNTNPLTIGAHAGPGGLLHAYIDQLILYNRILSEPTILRHSKRRYPL